MHLIWLVILIAVLIFVAVLLIRAKQFIPKAKQPAQTNPVEFDYQHVGEHLSQMIALRTVSSRNPELVDKTQFEQFPKLLNKLYPNAFAKLEKDTAGETGLIYRFKGRSSQSPCILMAHYDVVPANESEWSFDAFSGEIVDGIVRGRGAIDTKSTLCAIFEAIEKHSIENFVPNNDIYLCFSGTEEIAGESAFAIVENLRSKGVKPVLTLDEGGAIVTGVFPTVKNPCAVIGLSEKGQMAIKLTAKMPSGHASAPPKTTAFDELAKAVVALKKNPFKPKMTFATKSLFLTLGKHCTFPLRIVFANLWLFTPLLKAAARSLGSDINALMRTTYVFTMASGSDASNVMPSEASVTCDVRILPCSTSKDVLTHFEKTINNKNIIIEPIFTMEPSPISPANGFAFENIEASINETFPNVIVSPYLMTARSDSSAYTAICDNVYRFAPLELSSEQRSTIHGKDEQLPVKTLVKACEFYYRLIQKL